MKAKIAGLTIVAGLIGSIALLSHREKIYTNQDTSVAKVLSYVENVDGLSGISDEDRRDLRRRFFETDPRHFYALQNPMTRMQPHVGNTGLEINDDCNVEEVLWRASHEEIRRVLDSYEAD